MKKYITKTRKTRTKGVMSNPSEAQNYRLWVALNITTHSMLGVREKDLARYNVSNMESAILNAAYEIGYGATPAQITRKVETLKPHSVSELLTLMEQKGLIVKYKDLPKKNLVRIELTEKGLQTHLKTARRESIHRMFSSLTDEEKNSLENILNTLKDEASEESLLALILYKKES
jgi:DNA-binding MarR family transcriptional regulator